MCGAEGPPTQKPTAVYTYCHFPIPLTALHEMLRSIGEQHGMKLGKAQAPLRVAITGRSVGPPLFESMQFLGRETVVQRITAAQQKLDTNKPIDSP